MEKLAVVGKTKKEKPNQEEKLKADLSGRTPLRGGKTKWGETNRKGEQITKKKQRQTFLGAALKRLQSRGWNVPW